MSKKGVMISIDEFIHKKAQAQHLNISELCEKALRFKTEPKKADVPEDSLVLKCSQCASIIEYGYMCEILQLFICAKCESKFPCVKKDHEHNRIPKLEE